MKELCIERFAEGRLQTNTYLLFGADAEEAVLVDPAGVAQQPLNFLRERKLSLSLVLITHGHADHIEALDIVRDATGAKAAVSVLDAPMLTGKTPRIWGSSPLMLRPADMLLQDGDVLTTAAGEVRCLHTPGHTPGGMCYILGHYMFTGDTLFQGSIGRTDFPLADGEAMAQSLKKLVALEGDMLVFPGHGPETTLNEERAFNPFLRFGTGR